MIELSTSLTKDNIRLEPMTDHHVEGLRAACAQDTEVWDIYPLCFLGEHFDVSLQIFRSDVEWVSFAILNDNMMVGMSHYIRPNILAKSVEIGGTYIAPSVRGTGFNDIIKKLMIDHAFDCGFETIGFRVDSRNKRSQAAVRKLGAKHKETLEKNLITWTGYVRDTMVFQLHKGDWVF